MKKTLSILVGVASLSSLAFMAVAQDAHLAPQPHRGSAETSLLGISLYDPGTRVIAKYGSPLEVLPLTVGGQAGAAGPTGGGPNGVPNGRPGASAAGGGGRGGGSAGSAEAEVGPDGFFGVLAEPGAPVSEMQKGMAAPGVGGPGASTGPGGNGFPGGGPGGPGRPGAGNSGAMGGGQGNKIVYTRWVYKRNNCKYSFVLDKFNRVVQIEAIGMKNSSVHTRRGISFGSSFGTIISKYNAPDGYEINGDSLVVRYLVRDRVAFRLNKLDPKKQHVVTGIVVAAGKT